MKKNLLIVVAIGLILIGIIVVALILSSHSKPSILSTSNSNNVSPTNQNLVCPLEGVTIPYTQDTTGQATITGGYLSMSNPPKKLCKLTIAGGSLSECGSLKVFLNPNPSQAETLMTCYSDKPTDLCNNACLAIIQGSSDQVNAALCSLEGCSTNSECASRC